MGVMMLAAPQGCELTFTIEGNDEQAAISAIELLINNRFGEGE
jgi:phosphocarrier protein HPr